MTTKLDIEKLANFYNEGNQINPLLIELLYQITEKRMSCLNNCSVPIVNTTNTPTDTSTGTSTGIPTGIPTGTSTTIPTGASTTIPRSSDPFIDFIQKIDDYIKSFSYEEILTKPEFFIDLDDTYIKDFINETHDIMRFSKNDSTKIIDKNINMLDTKKDSSETLAIFKQKKQFYDINTDFISRDKIFVDSDQESIFKFQYLVNTFFIKIIEEYKNRNRLSEESLYFVYKGGTFLKILFEKYKGKLSDPSNKSFIERNKTFFNRSDSDYGIFIDNKFDINQYTTHYYNMNVITYNILQKINIFIDQNIKDILPLNKITEQDLVKQLAKINKHLNDNRKSLPFFSVCEEFIGIQCYDKLYMKNSIPDDFKYYKLLKRADDDDVIDVDDELTPLVFESNMKKDKKISIKRKAFYITPKEFSNKLCSSIGIIPNKELNSGLYQYYNETNRFETIKPNGQAFLSYFSLQRVKINFVLYFKTYYGYYGYFRCPSELIDISINTWYDEKRAVDTKKTLKMYYNILKGKKINFCSYTIYGLIMDIYKALFEERNYPWNDEKYTKKINRLVFFLIIHINNNYSNYSEILTKMNQFLNDFELTNISNTNLILYDGTTIKGILDDLYYKFFDYIIQIKKSIDSDSVQSNKEKYQNMIQLIRAVINMFKSENIHYSNENPESVNFLKKYLKYKKKYLQLKNF